MDGEARALVERATTTENPTRKRKRKRRVSEHIPEIHYVREQYTRFCSEGLGSKYFPGEPTLADIGANNSEMRRIVASRMQAVEEEEAGQKRQLTAENSTNRVVLRDGILMPPSSRYIKW
jgi:hypothetical protein